MVDDTHLVRVAVFSNEGFQRFKVELPAVRALKIRENLNLDRFIGESFLCRRGNLRAGTPFRKSIEPVRLKKHSIVLSGIHADLQPLSNLLRRVWYKGAVPPLMRPAIRRRRGSL